MSRTEQIIGRTNKAENFLQVIQTKKNFISKEPIVLVDSLPYSDNKLMGFKINVKPDFADVNESEYFLESVQFIMHSSGPMFFTHFKHFLIKKNGQKIELGDCYSWIKDPLLDTEFDKASDSFNM